MSKILITGGSGFIGKHVSQKIDNALSVGSKQADLTKPEQTSSLFKQEIDTIIHLAGWNGGIAFNQAHPKEVYNKNIQISHNILSSCIKYNVKTICSLIASCGYPETNKLSIEDSYLEGIPHPSVACHGLAKRHLFSLSRDISRIYGINAICLCPCTVFGPGDFYEPCKSKVATAVIYKITEAIKKEFKTVSFWGQGNAIRDFIYVKDCATLICELSRSYCDTETIINISPGWSMSIKDFTHKVAEILNYKGTIQFLGGEEGQLFKSLDNTKLSNFLDYQWCDFDTAILETSNWISSHIKN